MKREYYIGNEHPRKDVKVPINQTMVIRCRPVIANYRTTPLHKQFFKLMEWCRDNSIILSKGTIIATLRPKLDVRPITREELDHFNVVVFYFRKWLGALAGMVVYAYRDRLSKTGPIEWLFRPLKNKREYMKFAGKRIEAIDTGLRNRHSENIELLSMTQSQIERRINAVSVEIDNEVNLPNDKRKNRRNRK